MLVIEDNKDVASYIGGQFDSRYAVVYAENGQVGLEKALELVPDLIVTDLMMPGLDGLEVCRQVRNSEIINHVPIIIITAKITEEARIKGIEAGADAYLANPSMTTNCALGPTNCYKGANCCKRSLQPCRPSLKKTMMRRRLPPKMST